MTTKHRKGMVCTPRIVKPATIECTFTGYEISEEKESGIQVSFHPAGEAPVTKLLAVLVNEWKYT